MISSHETLKGTLKPDGTLELDSSPSLAPGRVLVTLQSMPARQEPSAPGWWEVAERIWAERAASGRQPRTKEQIDADLAALRAELDDRLEELERIHELAQKDRQPQDKPLC